MLGMSTLQTSSDAATVAGVVSMTTNIASNTKTPLSGFVARAFHRRAFIGREVLPAPWRERYFPNDNPDA
jgi:hypothetical protein